MALDSDTAFAFQIHIIKHLPLSHLYSLSVLKQPIGQSALAMVYVRNNAKVAYVFHFFSGMSCCNSFVM